MEQQIINIQESFSMQNIILYFIIINIIGFFIMWLDKRKAKKGAWRIPEKSLFLITALRWRNWYNCWYVCISP